VKRIGILGGLSAESTVSYYQRITREHIRRFGEPRYPEIVIFSVTFQEYAEWQHDGRWDVLGQDMLRGFNALAAAGADFAVIASNTVHYVMPDIEQDMPLPLLHIVDAVADSVKDKGLTKVALLGTQFTMSKSFYPDGLTERGIECMVPAPRDQAAIHRVIYGELVNGVIRDESRRVYNEIVNDLVAKGAQGVIMGCTEIPLLLRQEDFSVPLFDSAVIHADAALNMALLE